jgi:hypothetical protein
MRSDIRRQTGLQLSVYVHKELDKMERTMFRENGYYWITAWEKRIIAYWDSFEWLCCGSNISIAKEHITDINENRIIENGTEHNMEKNR